ncbi:hypothetical protein QAD02_000870, partial [Eretmocerus hayati]
MTKVAVLDLQSSKECLNQVEPSDFKSGTKKHGNHFVCYVIFIKIQQFSENQDMDGFDRNTVVLRTMMRLMGLWPETIDTANETSRYKNYAFVMTMIVGFVLLPQILVLLLNENDFTTILSILNTSICSFTLVTAKLIEMQYHHYVYKGLLRKVRSDWELSTPAQRVVIEKNYRICKRVFYYFVIEVSIALQLIVVNVFGILYSYGFNNYTDRYLRTELLMPVKTDYIVDVSSSPIFEIVWLLQYCALVIGAVAYIISDAFIEILLSHVYAQLENLREDLKNMDFSRPEQDVSAMIKNVVKRYVSYRKFMDQIQENAGLVYLLEIFIYTLLICFEGYMVVVELTTTKNFINMGFVLLYMSTNLLTLYTLCYFSQKLMNVNEAISSAIYETEWYKLAPRQAKLLLMTMRESTRPFEFTAGGMITFSHESYVK